MASRFVTPLLAAVFVLGVTQRVARADECATPPASPADAAGPTEPQPPSAPASSADPVPPQDTPSAAESLGRTEARVKCLDQTLVDEFGRARARRGVQPRYFRKARRAVLSIGGGAIGGDSFDTQWQVAGNLGFWFTEDFGIDADFKLSPKTFRLERAATNDVTGEDRYPDGIVDNFAYIVMGHLLWSPIHTKLRARGDRIIHGDFVVFGGAGSVFHDSSHGVGFDLGMSLYLYPARFVSLRIDISNQILAEELYGSRRITNNLVFNFGVGLWLPFRIRGDS